MDAADVEPTPQLFRRIACRGFSPDDFETKQVFVASKDGTRIPMFIVHRKGLALDGTAPTLLYGYGGFNISLEPGFSVSRVCWMLAYNGVYAVANLRGGEARRLGGRPTPPHNARPAPKRLTPSPARVPPPPSPPRRRVWHRVAQQWLVREKTKCV